jgi:hypothetical protein
MHIIDSFGKKTLWSFQNCNDIVCECHRTNATGETKMKFHAGSETDFEWACVPMSPYMAVNAQGMSLHFLSFPQGVCAFWRICRHIIGKLTIRDYIYQVSARCPPSKLLRNLQVRACFHFEQRRNQTARSDLSSNRYVKNTLRIDSKQRLPCFCRYYGVNLEKSLRCNDWIFRFFS